MHLIVSIIDTMAYARHGLLPFLCSSIVGVSPCVLPHGTCHWTTGPVVKKQLLNQKKFNKKKVRRSRKESLFLGVKIRNSHVHTYAVALVIWKCSSLYPTVSSLSHNVFYSPSARTRPIKSPDTKERLAQGGAVCWRHEYCRVRIQQETFQTPF